MDNSGFINIKEMIEYLHSVCDDQVDPDDHDDDDDDDDDQVDEAEVRGIFSKMDVTGDRTVDFWEFEV